MAARESGRSQVRIEGRIMTSVRAGPGAATAPGAAPPPRMACVGTGHRGGHELVGSDVLGNDGLFFFERVRRLGRPRSVERCHGLAPWGSGSGGSPAPPAPPPPS